MKTITMTQLRAAPGEYAHLVYKHGESFLVTSQGRPVFRMVPTEEATIIRSDGSFVGPKPLTFRENLGGEYGGRLVFDKARRTIVRDGKPLNINIEDTVLA